MPGESNFVAGYPSRTLLNYYVMDKPLRIVIYVVLGLVVFHLVFDLFNTRSNIKTVIQNLEKSRANVDSALNEIRISQDKLKSMQEDLDKFSLYIKDIQGRVELNDMQKILDDKKYALKKDSIRGLIDKMKVELKITDTLPDILEK